MYVNSHSLLNNFWKIIKKNTFFQIKYYLKKKIHKQLCYFNKTFVVFKLLRSPFLSILYWLLHRHYSLPNVRVRVSYLRNPNFGFVRKNISLRAFLMQCYNYYALFSLPGFSFPLKSSILKKLIKKSKNSHSSILI